MTTPDLGPSIATPISMFWNGGMGSTLDEINQSLEDAGLNPEIYPAANKKEKVRAALRDCDDDQAQKLADRLLETLRSTGYFEELTEQVDSMLNRVNRALAPWGKISISGEISWKTSKTLNDETSNTQTRQKTTSPQDSSSTQTFKSNGTPNPTIRVFIGASSESDEMAKEFVHQIRNFCTPTLWSSGVFGAGQYTLEALEKVARENDFAVLLAGSDDLISSRDNNYRVARDNVILEYGLFVGSIGRHRTYVLPLDDVRLPSDLSGITTLTGARSSQNRQEREQNLYPAVQDLKEAVENHGPLLGPHLGIIHQL